MAVDKINTTAWASIASVTGVAKASIASFGGVTAPAAASSGVVSDNLHVWFGPDDITGSTVNDKNGGSVTATMSNGASVVTSLRSAGSFYSDGANDVILADMAPSAQPSTTTWPATFECWMYPPAGSNPLNVVVVNDPTSNVDWLRMYMDSRSGWGGTPTHNIHFQQYANGSGKWHRYTSTSAYPTVNSSAWVHLCMTLELTAADKTLITAYANGSELGTSLSTFTGSLNVPPWSNSPSSFNFGINHMQRDSASEGYYGESHAGDCRLYTDALTSTEIVNNYDVEKASYGH